MLEHLGEENVAKQLMKAIETLTASGKTLPKDLGGNADTAQVTHALCDALEEIYGKA